EGAPAGMSADAVAVANKCNRPPARRFGTDMADAKAARGAGKAAIGNQRDLGAHALSIKSSGGRQHFAHARSAFGALVADHQHVAFLILPVLHRFEAGFLAVKATGRTRKLQTLHASHFHHPASAPAIAFPSHTTPGPHT